MNPNDYKTPTNPNYDFILNPVKPKRTFHLGGGSKLKKISIVIGILIVGIILFVIIKNLTTTKILSITDFKNVIIEQQRIINIVQNDLTDTKQLSKSQLNSVATLKLSIPSEQSALLAYLKNTSNSISTSVYANVKTTSVDNQLSTALANGNLSSSYNLVMKNELNNYMSYLSTCYNTTKGSKGKALIKQEYQNATLLIKQFN